MLKLNGYWLAQQNKCDILCKIQNSFLEGSYCILDAIDETNTNHDCDQHQNVMVQQQLCRKCIEKWINTERGKKESLWES